MIWVFLILQILSIVAQVFYANVLTRNLMALYNALKREMRRAK